MLAHLLHFALCAGLDNRIVLLHIAKKQQQPSAREDAKNECVCAFCINISCSLSLSCCPVVYFIQFNRHTLRYFICVVFFLPFSPYWLYSRSICCVCACVCVYILAVQFFLQIYGYLYATLLVIYDVHFISFELNQIN